MRTNFYLLTTKKDIALKYAPYSYELIDVPYLAYSLHAAKTSARWLPNFQSHKDGIMAVHGYDTIDEGGNPKHIYGYDDAYQDGCKIFDEYGTEYNWNEFTERVLKFNGGTVKDRKVEKVPKRDVTSMYWDPNLPDHIPISHFEYGDGKYANDFYTDPDGYEFDKTWFR